MADPLTLLQVALNAAPIVEQGIKYLTGSDTTSPFGEQAKLIPRRTESEQEQKFKERINPRLEKLFEQQINQLEQPYQSPSQRLGQSQVDPVLQAFGPQFMKDISGVPGAGVEQWLAPLIGQLAGQGGQYLDQRLFGGGMNQQPQQPQQPQQLQQPQGMQQQMMQPEISMEQIWNELEPLYKIRDSQASSPEQQQQAKMEADATLQASIPAMQKQLYNSALEVMNDPNAPAYKKKEAQWAINELNRIWGKE